jgi:hypothetical protein
MMNKFQATSNFTNLANNLQITHETHNQNGASQQLMQTLTSDIKIDPFEKLKLLIVKNNQLNQQKFNNMPNEANQSLFLKSNNLTNNQQVIKSIEIEQQLQNQHNQQQQQNSLKSFQKNAFHSFETSQVDQVVQKDNSKIEINLDGVIKNIPPNVLLDQFGMLGLAIMVNHRDDQSQFDEDVSVVIGKGQTSFRFLQKSQTLFQNNNESVLKNQNQSSNECLSIDDSDLLAPFQNASLLDDYKISSNRLKLIDPNDLLHTHVNEDLLFYLFYMCCQDELQHKAYTILCAKNWIYNKELKVWFKPVSNNSNQQTYELNSNHYFVFDVNAWEIKLVNSNNKSKFKSAAEQTGEF